MVHFLEYWENTKEMPWPLSMLCQGGMVATPVLLILLLLPVFEWNFDGSVMPYSELWKSGSGFVFVLFFALASTGFWGIAARNSNARWLLVLTPLAPSMVANLIFPDLLATLVHGALTAAMVYGCLFHLPAVKRYFVEPRVTDV